MNSQQLCMLKYLAAWRESQAVREDRNRKRILSDEALYDLCVNPPSDLAQLFNKPLIKDKLIREHGSTILKLIKQGQNTPEKERPSLPKFKKLSQEEEALANCLMAIIHLSASNNNISPRCLCSRKDIEKLLRGQKNIAVLSGWRKELAGKQLLNFLSGDANISFSENKLDIEAKSEHDT